MWLIENIPVVLGICQVDITNLIVVYNNMQETLICVRNSHTHILLLWSQSELRKIFTVQNGHLVS